MAGIVRLMVYRNGVTNVVDCLYTEVKETRLRSAKKAGSCITARCFAWLQHWTPRWAVRHQTVTAITFADAYASCQMARNVVDFLDHKAIALIQATKWMETLPQMRALYGSQALSCQGQARAVRLFHRQSSTVKVKQVEVAYNQLSQSPRAITGTTRRRQHRCSQGLMSKNSWATWSGVRCFPC